MCVVCGWRDIAGVICHRRRCRGRYFLDLKWGIVRGKGRIKISKAQRELFLNVRKWCNGLEVVQEVIFPWAIASKGAGYRFDIAVPSLKLLVEYDSRIHDKFNKHFHGTKAGFIDTQLRDQLKDGLAKAAGWDLIRVKEGDPLGGLDVRRHIEAEIGRKRGK